IADGSILTAKIGANAVDSTKIADLAVTNAKVADTAVTTQKLADGAITNIKVDAAAGISGSKLAAGSGPLANLDGTGQLDFGATHTNKHLGNIPDDPGGTWLRVAGIQGNKVQAGSVGLAAIGGYHLNLASTIGGSGNEFSNGALAAYSNGVSVPPDNTSVNF